MTGVDSSAVMQPLPADWRLLVADARSLPLESESFDVVIAAYVVHLWWRREQSLDV